MADKFTVVSIHCSDFLMDNDTPKRLVNIRVRMDLETLQDLSMTDDDIQLQNQQMAAELGKKVAEAFLQSHTPSFTEKVDIKIMPSISKQFGWHLVYDKKD